MDGRTTFDGAFTLRGMVVERIRSSIVSGRSAPGTLFSVPTWACELNISTTPVREALLELARSGLSHRCAIAAFAWSRCRSKP